MNMLRIELYLRTFSRVRSEISNCQYHPQNDFYRDCLIYELQIALGLAWDFTQSQAVSDWNITLQPCNSKSTEKLVQQVSREYLPLLQAFANHLADSLTMVDYLQLPASAMLEIIKTDSKFNFRTNPEAVRAFEKQLKKETLAQEELRKKKMTAEFGTYDPSFYIDPLPRHRPNSSCIKKF